MSLLDELERKLAGTAATFDDGDFHSGYGVKVGEIRALLAVARAAQVVDRDICRLEDDEYLVAPEAADLLSAALAQLEGA